MQKNQTHVQEDSFWEGGRQGTTEPSSQVSVESLRSGYKPALKPATEACHSGHSMGVLGERTEKHVTDTKGHTGTHSTALPTTLTSEAAPQSAD